MKIIDKEKSYIMSNLKDVSNYSGHPFGIQGYFSNDLDSPDYVSGSLINTRNDNYPFALNDWTWFKYFIPKDMVIFRSKDED